MFDSDRVVVTGFGVALPGGCDESTLWARLEKGEPAFAPCKPYGEAGLQVWAGQVQDSGLDVGVSKRNAKKMDRFTHLALSAAQSVLADAELESEAARERVGMMIGNATGGWAFVEPMMYGLYREGMHHINPYVATAWFPAAAQGEISIHHRLGGYSKTISADRLSGGLAIEHAARLVQAGREPVILAGGAEAPLSALVVNAYRTAGGTSDLEAHAAFEHDRTGAVLGEGAAFAALEDQDHAVARGARIRARLRGVGRGASLEVAILRALATAGKQPRDVDYVILDGAGKGRLDAQEYEALGKVFAGHDALKMSAPSRLYGDLIGATCAASFVIGCLALEHQTAFPTPKGERPLVAPPVGSLVVDAPVAFPMRNVLVYGRDDAGRAIAFLVERA